MKKIFYKSGQVWSLKDRNDIKILILKEEILNNLNIVHISILRDGIDEGCHMPFHLKVIQSSTSELFEESHVLPEYEDGYEYWVDLYEKGEAGVYSVSPSEAIDF